MWPWFYIDQPTNSLPTAWQMTCFKRPSFPPCVWRHSGPAWMVRKPHLFAQAVGSWQDVVVPHSSCKTVRMLVVSAEGLCGPNPRLFTSGFRAHPAPHSTLCPGLGGGDQKSGSSSESMIAAILPRCFRKRGFWVRQLQCRPPSTEVESVEKEIPASSGICNSPASFTERIPRNRLRSRLSVQKIIVSRY